MNLFALKEESIFFPYNFSRITEAKEMGSPFTLRNVLVFSSEEREITDDEMIILAARGGSFDFLNDERENIYTESDGTPL